uniref:(northern house mosquito) hypothetical protein n=1 Tax=Culex pipiens TaxID=7175 RepID=A0A8D8FBS2_CULPI
MLVLRRLSPLFLGNDLYYYLWHRQSCCCCLKYCSVLFVPPPAAQPRPLCAAPPRCHRSYHWHWLPPPAGRRWLPPPGHRLAAAPQKPLLAHPVLSFFFFAQAYVPRVAIDFFCWEGFWCRIVVQLCSFG